MNPINVELYRKLLAEARYYRATERIMFFEYWLRIADADGKTRPHPDRKKDHDRKNR